MLIFQERALRLKGEVSVVWMLGISLSERMVSAYVFRGFSSPDIGMGQISHNNTCASPFWLCLKMLCPVDGHIIDLLADLACLDEVRELAGYIFPGLVIGVCKSGQRKTFREKALLSIAFENIIENSIG